MTLPLAPPIWKEAPFLRILIPLATGIFLRENVTINPIWLIISVLSLLFFFFSLHFSRLYFKFKYNWVTGIFINLLLLGTGYLICEAADKSNRSDCALNLYSPADEVMLLLEEPLIEKRRSYKATASIVCILRGDSVFQASGKVNVYFSKHLDPHSLNYGSTLVVSKSLEKITSSGNPGAFDYQLYCARQAIYYSVFLAEKDFELLTHDRGNAFKRLLFEAREKVLATLSTYIQRGKELGLAKALLIGYKDELDKNLVQAYSNTGVVHIIAISGLHLGIIYWLLSILLSPLQKIIRWRWSSTLLILTGLWLFSLLAGAGPSVLRSAFMFSMIALGASFSKTSNVFNSLAFSAFALLCYNPFWLWDAGFQLSYAAVISIVLFFKPIYQWFYFTNKIVDFAWKLIAVTLAAQILTLPIGIYHFHQLPLYFILSNLLAVPLSSIILIAEILICCFSFIPMLSSILGSSTTWMIQILNTYIENINQLPLGVWNGLQISFLQCLLLFLTIGGAATWLMNKIKTGLWTALTGTLLFVCLRTVSFLTANNQLKLIVYNLQNATAIDFINGRKLSNFNDARAIEDVVSNHFVLQASRSLNRVRETPTNQIKPNSPINVGGKMLLLLNDRVSVPHEKAQIDILIIANNARVQLSSLISAFSPKQIVTDASNSKWRAAKWEEEAKSYQVPLHNVRVHGAYVLNFR